jgi:hypothetical protein
MTYTPPEEPTNNVPPAAPPAPPLAAPQAYAPAYQQTAYPQQPPTEGLAIAALITGILFWPVGIILGFVALSKIKKTGAGGRIMAILGIVFGFLGLVATIIAIVAGILFARAAAATAAQIASDYDDTYGSYGEVQDSVAIGETGTTDEGIEFTVSAVECGIETVGPEDFGMEALGQYCRADLTVTNNSDESQYFSSSSATAFAGDTEYAADPSASFYDENAESYASELTPGQSSAEAVYFDIPDGETLTRLELAGTFIGGVVEVTL